MVAQSHSMARHQLVGLVLMSMVYGGQGCVFHCKTETCGAGMELTTAELYVGGVTWLFDKRWAQHGLREGYAIVGVVNLSSSGITGLAPGAFDCFRWNQPAMPSLELPLLGVVLDNNPLMSIPNGSLFAEIPVVSLSGCGITNVTAQDLAEYRGGNSMTGFNEAESFLFLYLNSNAIESVPLDLFSKVQVSCFVLDLSVTHLTSLPGSMLSGFKGTDVALNVANTRLTDLPDKMFAGSVTPVINAVYLTATRSGIQSAGGLFEGLTSGIMAAELDLRFNSISATDVQSIFTSYKQVGGSLGIYAGYNNITAIPDFFFKNLTGGSPTISSPRLLLNMTGNPLYDVSRDMFSGARYLGDISLCMSFPTAGRIKFPTLFLMEGNPTFAHGATLVVDLSATGADVATTAAFNKFLWPCSKKWCACGEDCKLLMTLAHNNISVLGPDSCANTRVTSLDLQYNNMTYISSVAFSTTSYDLQILDLSHNSLNLIPIELQNNLPGLRTLKVAHNLITAIPTYGNRINVSDAMGNPLQCATYMPLPSGCKCTHGNLLPSNCGYTRCMQGCTPTWAVNATCSPWMKCFDPSHIPTGHYFDTVFHTMLPLTECNATFKSETIRAKGYRQGYEVTKNTLTTDRVCSLCTTCPSGISDRSPCTATSDTVCETPVQKVCNDASVGTLVGIGVAIFVIPLLSIIFCWYVRRSSREPMMRRSSRQREDDDLVINNMEQVERRVSTTQVHKTFGIEEADVNLRTALGSNGRMFSGQWRTRPVAIRMLGVSIDDLTPDQMKGFDQEVTLMRTVYHPHLVKFFGAGIDSQSRPFLVFEFMTGSTLSSLLHDTSKRFDWPIRLRVAADICAGLRYLHEVGTAHQALSSKNCFVDDKMQAKVGDFSASVLAYTHTRPSGDAGPVSGLGLRSWSDTSIMPESTNSQTCPGGAASWPWMAPEALEGQECTTPEELEALDVYSYALVIWSIWTRLDPWEDVLNPADELFDEGKRLVVAGERPKVPRGCEASPDGFFELIQWCWSDVPSDRPNLETVGWRLASIARTQSVAGAASAPRYEDDYSVNNG
eukprot:m.171987 g.171987  ORF g.171987 m.171987 type:complete len:1063 (-) comp13456_c0_seq1:96-3284(-)